MLRGEKVEPNYKKPFDLVAEGKETENWYPLVDYFTTGLIQYGLSHKQDVDFIP